jgi:hypothetical protein
LFFVGWVFIQLLLLGAGLAILCGLPQAHRALEGEVWFRIEAKACAIFFKLKLN